MKSPRTGTAVAVMLLQLFSVVACTHSLKEQTFNSPHAQVDLLIAGDASEYKDALRQLIIDNYRDHANIQVVNIDKLEKKSEEDFHAILIMDTCLAWTQFNPTVLSFLERPTAKKRAVWFMTVDDTEEHYQHNGVDAITAASVVENRQSVAAQLIQKIEAVISSTP